MGAWYIDRSRNLSEETKWIKSLLFSIDRIDPFSRGIDSNELIGLLPDILKSGKNPNAILTYLRDIGFLNLDNKLGDNSKLLLSNHVGYKDLIFELLFKRPYAKDQKELIRPFVVILLTLHKIYLVTCDFNQMYLSWYECCTYLFDIKQYTEIENNLIQKILQSRQIQRNGEPKAVLDIWFNALKKFPLFNEIEEKHIIFANPDYFDFFELIESSIDKLEIKADEYNNNRELYNYYGKMNNGLVDIIPDFETTGLASCLESNKSIIDHLFGFEYHQSIKENFGVLKQFRWCMSLGLRRIYIDNNSLGEKLIAETLMRSNEYYENKLYIKITQEYVENKQRNVEEQIVNKYINDLLEYQLDEKNLRYRLDVLSAFANKCILCGESRTELLNAARIKPFSSEFDISEAFDIDNSLLLCLEHSRYFEQGLITFDMAGRLNISNADNYKKYHMERFRSFRIPESYLTMRRRKYLGYHSIVISKKN